MTSDSREINLFGMIGEEYTAAWLHSELDKCNGEAVVININCPGGAIFEAIAMSNMLQQYQANVVIHVLGMAYGAACLLLAATPHVYFDKAACLGLGRVVGATVGGTQNQEQTAEHLNTIESVVKEMYAKKGIAADVLDELMESENILSAEEAVKIGWGKVAA